MLTYSKRRSLPLVLVVTVVTLLVLYHRSSRVYVDWTVRQPANANLSANSTLGFGAILVVSKPGASRQQPLLQAANVTEIELTIPQQPQWTDRDVEDFRNGQDTGVHKGSILAWMGHRNVLQW